MPTKVKQGLAKTILNMMGTSVVLGILSWATIELVKSHDSNINVEHMKDDIKILSDKQDDYDAKVIFLMQAIFDIKLNVKESQINVKYCKEDSIGHEKVLTKLIDRINDNIHSH